MAEIMNVDVIINGAGVVGKALALSLLQQGFSVALVDPKPLTVEMGETVDLRVRAINESSQQLFSRMGIWDALLNSRHCAYDNIHVWNQSGEVHYHADEVGKNQLGYIVEEQVLLSVLSDALLKENRLHFFQTKARSFKNLVDEVHVFLETGEHLQASLLVGADGTRSWVRRQANINLQSRDYGQSAIVATITTEKSHKHIARQRFLPTGPLVFLPLFDEHHCSIVWTLPSGDIAAYMQMDEVGFCQRLTEVFEGRLGKVTHVGERAQFKLMQREAKPYVKNHVALVGDAMHTIHPLAGLGLNLGLMDVSCLCDVLTEAKHNKMPIGDDRVLLAYQRRRKPTVKGMIIAMRFLKELYSNDNATLNWLRNEGMRLTEQQTWLKNLIIHQAAHPFQMTKDRRQ